MSKNVGYVVLGVGIALIVVSFAYALLSMLNQPLIPSSSNVAEAIGLAIAPLMNACIKVLFLGVMIWAGSIVSARGISLIKPEREEAKQKESSQKESKQKEAGQ